MEFSHKSATARRSVTGVLQSTAEERPAILELPPRAAQPWAVTVDTPRLVCDARGASRLDGLIRSTSMFSASSSMAAHVLPETRLCDGSCAQAPCLGLVHGFCTPPCISTCRTRLGVSVQVEGCGL